MRDELKYEWLEIVRDHHHKQQYCPESDISDNKPFKILITSIYADPPSDAWKMEMKRAFSFFVKNLVIDPEVAEQLNETIKLLSRAE
ncbi:MAG: hypothetical protein O7C60_07415 [Rickettsia endosymbiont of Ixodes persulcatus]|nr:hypothetical protein [Rickettsia endosymbiont of Ixodes persulcatus]